MSTNRSNGIGVAVVWHYMATRGVSWGGAICRVGARGVVCHCRSSSMTENKNRKVEEKGKEGVSDEVRWEERLKSGEYFPARAEPTPHCGLEQTRIET